MVFLWPEENLLYLAVTWLVSTIYWTTYGLFQQWHHFSDVIFGIVIKNQKIQRLSVGLYFLIYNVFIGYKWKGLRGQDIKRQILLKYYWRLMNLLNNKLWIKNRNSDVFSKGHFRFSFKSLKSCAARGFWCFWNLKLVMINQIIDSDRPARETCVWLSPWCDPFIHYFSLRTKPHQALNSGPVCRLYLWFRKNKCTVLPLL